MESGLGVAVAVFLAAATITTEAQTRGRAAPQQQRPQAQQAAALDLTGYWVSVVIEDWKWRMVTPKKGEYMGVPLSAEGRKVADTWDPARDESAGEQCRSYGAANIMRVPGRLHITWQDADTLRIDTDAGTQSRLLYFGAAPAPAAPSWQGLSRATWDYGPARGRGAARTGSLKAVTTNLRPGYVRKNGIPYSSSAVVTEYFDVNTLPNGDQWLTVTTRVDEPVYFGGHYLTSSDFQKLPSAAGWNPTPCSAR